MNFKLINKTIFSLVIITFFFVDISAQKDRSQIYNKINTQKIAFISDQLQLTEMEAQKFWPIYNDYHAELSTLKENMNFGESSILSDEQADQQMEKVLAAKQKELDIQKKYISKMKSAIPSRKIALLFRVEQKFKEKLVSRIKNRKNQDAER